MEIIKQAIKLGNSAGVILPKGWENKKVRVEIIEDSISSDIFQIMHEKGLISEIMGIYLSGSYARGEERLDSDIDILIITEKTNKTIKEGNYEITLISKDKLEKNLEKNLYLHSMIKESKTILNDLLIREYKNKNLKLNKTLKEINSIIKINKEHAKILEEQNKKANDGLAYSVILRLRELLLIKCILENKNYTNKKLLEIIEKNSSKEIYEAYLRTKNDKTPKNNIHTKKILSLLDYSERLLKEIKNAKKEKKN